jgi:3-isopropylmalate/(R)-2-methylmalate dehydratase small subunit
MKLSGRVWKLGNEVGATDLLPAAYDKAAELGKAEECAAHVLEALRPEFQASRQPGDLIVGGQNLGVGHAHYHRGAVIGCRAAGIGALLAESVGGLFLRSSIDEGYPAWALPGIHAFVNDGDRLEIDLASGEACNLTQGTRTQFRPIDPAILAILDAGSTINWALSRYEATKSVG